MANHPERGTIMEQCKNYTPKTLKKRSKSKKQQKRLKDAKEYLKKIWTTSKLIKDASSQDQFIKYYLMLL